MYRLEQWITEQKAYSRTVPNLTQLKDIKAYIIGPAHEYATAYTIYDDDDAPIFYVHRPSFASRYDRAECYVVIYTHHTSQEQKDEFGTFCSTISK